MTDMMQTVAMPFRKRGKNALTTSEFIFALSLDLGWFSPEQAKEVLNKAKNDGLVSIEDDEISPNFDFKTIEIPLGFRPDLKREQSVFERTIERIMITGLSRKEAIALVNKKQESMANLIGIEISALLVAKERDIDIEDLIDETYQSLIDQKGK
ncbi:MAG: DUF2240 family protein [Methanocellales archaeon]|nr:DUF2240 family protein [Methanocellales archaeon]MDD4898193.1 DUF2240 family protein [Methanocellales archaeon]MDD5446992.1 DUF2240 family protein [Methanocellales archaeon]